MESLRIGDKNTLTLVTQNKKHFFLLKMIHNFSFTFEFLPHITIDVDKHQIYQYIQ